MADTKKRPDPREKQRCAAVTRAGKPCHCWATQDSAALYGRPLCPSHVRQAKRGGPDAPGAGGVYGRYFGADELAALDASLRAMANEPSLKPELATARVVLRRLLALMAEPGPDGLAMLRVAPLALESMRTIARLVRDNQAISQPAGDSFRKVLDTVLDELSEEWGVDL